MIKNEQQYKKSLALLSDFRRQVDEAKERYRDDDILLEMRVGPLEEHIGEIEAELKEYEVARAGKISPILTSFNPASNRLEIGRALVKLRLSKGITQNDLAKKLDTHQPSINRWENEEYEAYGIPDLKRIAGALGCHLDVVFVDEGRLPNSGAKEDQSLMLYSCILETFLQSKPALQGVLTDEAKNDLIMAIHRIVNDSRTSDHIDDNKREVG